jgi:hypothetical protein
MYFPGCSRRVGGRHSSWDGFYGKFDDLQRRDRGRLRDAHTFRAGAALLDRHDIGVRGLDAELEDGQSHYSIRVRIPPSRNAQDVLEEITALPGVKRVSVTGLRDLD